MAGSLTVASATLRYALPLGTIAGPAIAYAGLSSTPSLGPIALLLALWQLNASMVIPRRDYVYGLVQTLLVAIAIGFAHAGPAMGALSTPAVSVVIMSSFSIVTTIIAQSTIIASYFVQRAFATPWARVTFFPALWATVWGSIAQISPVGRLITWSPITGLGPYNWIRPIFGQWGLDWITAAWAVVLAEVAGSLIVGHSDASDEPIAPLRENLLDGDNGVNGPGTAEPERGDIMTRRLNSASSWRVLWLTTLLMGLAVPSMVSSSLPLSIVSPDMTPIGVACALPDTSLSGHYGGSPTLSNYISTSKALQDKADVILWPEGALRFENAAQRQDAFKEIQLNIMGQRYWGVTFEEYVMADSPDGVFKAGMRRNGLIVLTRKGPVFEYYKRKLVPGMSDPVPMTMFCANG